MNGITQNLGLRLIVSSIFLAFATIFIAGYFVYKQSQVVINNNALLMVSELSITIAQPDASSHPEDYLRRYMSSKSGGIWLMDSDGRILASTYPKSSEYAPGDTSLGNTVFRLKSAEKLDRFTDTKRLDVHMVTPTVIMSKYERGIAEYDYMGSTRTVAFKVIPESGWLLGIEKPIGMAYSELENIKKYIVIVCLISIIMVSSFSWLAIRKIIEPYYRDVEELNTRLTDSVRKLSTLHKASRSIQQILPVEKMLEETIVCIAEALGYDRVILHLVDAEGYGADLKMALVDGELLAPESMPKEVRSLKIDKENGMLERAIVEQRPYVIHNALTNDMVNKNRTKALGAREFAVVPLVAEGKSIGAVTVDNPSSRKPIREEDIDTLVIFADRVGLAIESARLHTELQNYATDLAATDSLTGLFNQTYFAEWLEGEVVSSRRENRPLSVVLAQVHHLKKINKRFGYAAGNIVLRRLGQIIASSLGEKEKGARFGGGEFIVGLYPGPEDRAGKIADELKRNVAAFRFKEKGLEGVDLSLAVSFGSLKARETAQDLLERLRKLAASDSK